MTGATPTHPIDSFTTNDAAIVALATLAEWDLVPDAGEMLPGEIQDLADTLTAAGFTTVGEIRANPTNALRTLTEVKIRKYTVRKNDRPSLKQAANPVTPQDGCEPDSPAMHDLHRKRNLLVALLAALALAASSDVDAAIAPLPVLRPRRTMHTHRPLCPDENLLTRILVTDSAVRPRGLQGATTYALVEGSATPGETTAVRVSSFHDLAAPRRFHLPGSTRQILMPYDEAFSTTSLPRRQQRVAREGELSSWGSRIVTMRLSQLRGRTGGELDPHTYVAYRGTHPAGGEKATQSAHPVIDRVLKRAGLYHHEDLTAKSVTTYAAAVAAARGDRDTAIALLGESEHRAKRLLTNPLPRQATRRATPRFRSAA